jgi:ATP-dependent RNA helicase DDX52/ROK1
MQLPKEDEHVKDVILHNIELSSYKEPTPIQMQAIPILLQRRDILGIAPTGSGKTAAYLIPTIAHLKAPKKDVGPRAIVISPTRELAGQIEREFLRLSVGKKFKICLLSKATAASAAHNVQHFDAVVSTPLRLVNLIKSGGIDLSHVNVLVMDEADRLFDLGVRSFIVLCVQCYSLLCFHFRSLLRMWMRYSQHVRPLPLLEPYLVPLSLKVWRI